jgi:hypothetical protein
VAAGKHAGEACTGRIDLYALIIVLTLRTRQLRQARAIRRLPEQTCVY